MTGLRARIIRLRLRDSTPSVPTPGRSMESLSSRMRDMLGGVFLLAAKTYNQAHNTLAFLAIGKEKPMGGAPRQIQHWGTETSYGLGISPHQCLRRQWYDQTSQYTKMYRHANKRRGGNRERFDTSNKSVHKNVSARKQETYSGKRCPNALHHYTWIQNTSHKER